MKLGIGTYTLTWSIGVPGYEPPAKPLDAAGLLRIAGGRGITLVQFADNLPLHDMTEAELAELKETADRLGITLEVGMRGTDPARLLDYLRVAKRLGASLCRTLITEAELEEPRRRLEEVLPAFAEAGVTIAVENHGLHTTRQLAALFEAVGSPYLGCCLDTVNSFSALDSPQTVVRDLSPYVVNLHVKDFDITRVDHQMGFAVLGKPAGYGKLDIPGTVAAIRAHGRNPSAILELWTPYAGSVEATITVERQWMEESLAYWKTIDFAE